MKKLNILGKEISILAIVGIMMAVGASAALVSYLSGTIEAEVGVTSPLDLWFAMGSGPETYIDLGDIVGGETIEYTTKAKNLAGEDVEVYRVLHVIESTEPFEGGEFKSVMLCDPRFHTCPGGGIELLPDLYHVKNDGTLVKFTEIPAGLTKVRLLWSPEGTTPTTYMHGAGETYTNYISIDTAENLVGEYDISLCHLYELGGDCPPP